ncbi:MAG: GNAT family N-acetyltransferase [Bacteroidetes bacterium]|nr:GNAT family N-acetyltransferase [Bacteroidota bacterium]
MKQSFVGEKVMLRAVEPGDVELLYVWENDPTIWHLGSLSAPLSRFVLDQYVMNANDDIYASRQIRFMIEKVTKGRPAGAIGTIDLFDFDPKNMRAGIGILIQQEERGKGYALESLHLLLEYCFQTIGMHTVYAGIPENNLPSIRLFERAGFIQSGMRKEWLKSGNQWINELFYQKLKD